MLADGDDDDDGEGEAALIEDEAPEDSASSRSQCTVCHRSMPVTRLGLIRVHGPVLNRCPGSRRPPAPVNTCQRGNIPDIADPVQAFKLRRFSVKILKRVPRASRDLSARNWPKFSIASHQTARSLPGIACSVSLRAAYECRIEAAIAEAWLHTPTSSSKRKRTLPSSSLPPIDEQVN